MRLPITFPLALACILLLTHAGLAGAQTPDTLHKATAETTLSERLYGTITHAASSASEGVSAMGSQAVSLAKSGSEVVANYGSQAVEFVKSTSDATRAYLAKSGEGGSEMLKDVTSRTTRWIATLGKDGQEFLEKNGSAYYDLVLSYGDLAIQVGRDYGQSGLDFVRAYGPIGIQLLHKYRPKTYRHLMRILPHGKLLDWSIVAILEKADLVSVIDTLASSGKLGPLAAAIRNGGVEFLIAYDSAIKLARSSEGRNALGRIAEDLKVTMVVDPDGFLVDPFATIDLVNRYKEAFHRLKDAPDDQLAPESQKRVLAVLSSAESKADQGGSAYPWFYAIIALESLLLVLGIGWIFFLCSENRALRYKTRGVGGLEVDPSAVGSALAAGSVAGSQAGAASAQAARLPVP